MNMNEKLKLATEIITSPREHFTLILTKLCKQELIKIHFTNNAMTDEG